MRLEPPCHFEVHGLKKKVTHPRLSPHTPHRRRLGLGVGVGRVHPLGVPHSTHQRASAVGQMGGPNGVAEAHLFGRRLTELQGASPQAACRGVVAPAAGLACRRTVHGSPLVAARLFFLGGFASPFCSN